jgi:hypothetical protein
MQPFAAEPISNPLPEPVVTTTPTVAVEGGSGAATSPVLRLPTQLHVAASTIPRVVLAAYVNAAKMTNLVESQCRVRWQILAGIGYVESDNARSGGSANPHWDGIANPAIYGPVLDGRDGVGRVSDTDGGALDGNSRWDRAVGPMQFLPSTWAVFGVDADGDGARNPQDINDAALAAAHYLCAVSPRLGQPRNLIRAVHAYNHSYAYVRAVLTAAASYLDVNPAALGINGLPKPPHRMGFTLDVTAPPAAAAAHHAKAKGAGSQHTGGSSTPPTIAPQPTVTFTPPPTSVASPGPTPLPTLPIRTPVHAPAPSPAPSSPAASPTLPLP